jgi:biopolymer transport protein ExbB
VRSNRLVLARLDAFAHDLFAVLTTGSHLGDTTSVVTLKPSVAKA